jgi:hypothetical protein
MTTENAQLARVPVADSAVALGTLGILAFGASMMTHEALGHGGYCMAAGGHNTALTAWAEGCNLHPVGIEAAGPVSQFGAGLLAWLVLRLLSPRVPRLRYGKIAGPEPRHQLMVECSCRSLRGQVR